MRKMLVQSIGTNAIKIAQSGRRDVYGKSEFRISVVGTVGPRPTWRRGVRCPAVDAVPSFPQAGVAVKSREGPAARRGGLSESAGEVGHLAGYRIS